MAAFVVVMAVLSFIAAGSEAAVYTVGDKAGWTIMGNVNYSLWSSSKTFSVGDTVLFTYNSTFHNVLEVNKADYQSCNAASPIATHTTGNDSIILKTKGDHYFLCGFPGHCQIGQKVEIKIGKASSAAPSIAPVLAPTPSSGAESGNSTGTPSTGTPSTGTPALSPHANGAVSSSFSVCVGLLLAVASFCF